MTAVLTEEMIQKLTRLRKQLHENAELPHQEYRTGEILEAFLEKETDFRIVRQEGWFYAVKDGRETEDVIAFRAEMDALPIAEGGKPVSHRCGHDGHMAAVCGVAVALKGIVPARTVCLVFQPAEEVGEGGELCAGILKEQLAVREIYACHNRSGYPEGSVICFEGLTQPASEGIILSLTGKASHASEPEKGRNPAGAAARLALLTAEMNQEKPLILSTVTGMRVGTGDFGISPGEGELRITLRAENECDMKMQEGRLLQQAEALAKEEGLRLETEIRDYFPETRNDRKCAQKVLSAARGLGLTVLDSKELWRASEDFGYYTREIPGAMFYVGNGTDHPPLHTDCYEFPDRILRVITEIFLALV